MSSEIFLAGASVRSAAQSAVRAGFRVAVADLFCDRDMPPECLACRVADYPREILDIARRVSPRSWSYTGGLENYPDLVEAISRRHRLLGNSAKTLRRVRDPWQLQQVLGRERIAYPEILAEAPHDAAGTWLHKPRRSAGGMHIGVFPHTAFRPAATSLAGAGVESARPAPVRNDPMANADEGSDDPPTGRYYQRRICGTSYGVAFVGRQGTATLLGVTRQLIGCQWAGATGFHYVGSIGPIALQAWPAAELQRIGDCLASEFSLRGLFGVDVIVAGSQIWVLEVNPRFTASIEILERATGLVAMAWHHAACCELPLPPVAAAHGNQIHAKAIVYARHAGVVNAEFYRALEWEPCAEFPCFADLPQEGTTISAGHPILTVFGGGNRIPDVLRQLRSRAAAVRRCLSRHGQVDTGPWRA